MSNALFTEQLIELLLDAQSRVIPIVGAELSTVKSDGQALPLVVLLARRLSAKLGVDAANLDTRDALNTVASRFVADRGDVEDVYMALKSVMPPAEELPIPAALRKLAEIRAFNLFITTTFDPLLVRAIDAVRFGGQPKTRVLAYAPNRIEDLEAGLLDDGVPVVYHLFGRLSPTPSYVVTQEDVVEFIHALQSETRQPARLFDEMRKDSLLILGPAFSDWLSRIFLRTAKNQRLLSSRGKTDFLADAIVDADDELREFLRHFGGRTKLFRGSAVQCVDELHQAWVQKQGTPAPATAAAPVRRGAPPGAVFVCFANEDREAAVRLCARLEAAGIEVFLDQQALAPGDPYEHVILRSIDHCSLFLALLSHRTLTPDPRFFRLEWDRAMALAKKLPPGSPFIVPVAIDDIQPNQDGLPAVFSGLHWARAPQGQADEVLLADVKAGFRRFQKLRMGAP